MTDGGIFDQSVIPVVLLLVAGYVINSFHRLSFELILLSVRIIILRHLFW